MANEILPVGTVVVVGSSFDTLELAHGIHIRLLKPSHYKTGFAEKPLHYVQGEVIQGNPPFFLIGRHINHVLKDVDKVFLPMEQSNADYVSLLKQESDWNH